MDAGVQKEAVPVLLEGHHYSLPAVWEQNNPTKEQTMDVLIRTTALPLSYDLLMSLSPKSVIVTLRSSRKHGVNSIESDVFMEAVLVQTL